MYSSRLNYICKTLSIFGNAYYRVQPPPRDLINATVATHAFVRPNWVDQIAEIGGMTEQEKKLGRQMTAYYVTDVLHAHGGNSEYCTCVQG
jgi:hypothetical protein